MIFIKYYIYKITCTETNKVYIGQTKNKRKRIDEHKYDLRHNIHHSVYMQRAFNKYGEKSFRFEVIEECSQNDVDNRECFWIKFYNSTNKKYGYNSESGGNKNKTLSSETKYKLSIKGKERYRTHYKFINEFRKKMSEIASSRIGKKTLFTANRILKKLKLRLAKPIKVVLAEENLKRRLKLRI